MPQVQYAVGDGKYLSKAAARLLFRHIPLSDVLLEWWEDRPEEFVVVSEQPSLCDATWVQGGEHHSGLVMEAPAGRDGLRTDLWHSVRATMLNLL